MPSQLTSIVFQTQFGDSHHPPCSLFVILYSFLSLKMLMFRFSRFLRRPHKFTSLDVQFSVVFVPYFFHSFPSFSILFHHFFSPSMPSMPSMPSTGPRLVELADRPEDGGAGAEDASRRAPGARSLGPGGDVDRSGKNHGGNGQRTAYLHL